MFATLPPVPVTSATASRPPVARTSAADMPGDVVKAYYRSLAAHDYAAAWHRWGGNGAASGHSLAAFRHGFAATRTTKVTITGPIDIEGGAGSLYATVPVSIEACLAGGRRQHFAGHYVVRRVNDVDGATPAQLRWHIDSAMLRQVP